MTNSLNLFPLNAVVFPYQKVPLRIFEPRYLRLIDDCYKNSGEFGICMIKEGFEVGAPAIPVNVGTTVFIEEFTRLSDKLFNIVVKGKRRFRIKRYIHEQPLINVEVEWIDKESPCFPGDYDLLRKLTTKLTGDRIKIPDDDCELFGLLGALLAVRMRNKQGVIELPETEIIPTIIRFLESI